VHERSTRRSRRQGCDHGPSVALADSLRTPTLNGFEGVTRSTQKVSSRPVSRFKRAGPCTGLLDVLETSLSGIFAVGDSLLDMTPCGRQQDFEDSKGEQLATVRLKTRVLEIPLHPKGTHVTARLPLSPNLDSGLGIEHDPCWGMVARVFLPTRPPVNTATH
jgi:hypothetical protein